MRSLNLCSNRLCTQGQSIRNVLTVSTLVRGRSGRRYQSGRHNKSIDEKPNSQKRKAKTGIYRPPPISHAIYSTPTPSPRKDQKSRKGLWIIGGLAVYSVTAYCVYLYRDLSRDSTDPPLTNVPEDVSDRYNETAKDFDNEVDLAEKLMGLGWLRRRLAKRAFGDVLEVSVGTGRNAKYYDLKKCKSITMVDQSGEMMEIARKKFRDIHPKYGSCTFLVQSAQDSIPSPSPLGFNTIVQSMGLCSTPNPSALLRHLGSLTNPKDGQIILLEHGRSHYAWLNRVLDNGAPSHANKHGCWWNRDVEKKVNDSGLEIVKIRRYHFGTTWWVELRPKTAV